MKVAVTSASGQLGKTIAKRCIQEFGQENVIGLARTPSKAEDLGIEIRKGDYDNANDFIGGLEGVDVVIILSGNDAPEARIPQHRNIINGAKQSGVSKIVYTSIYGEIGKCAFDSIILSNRQTEKDIIESGLQYAIGRNGLYIEPDIEAIPMYKEEGEIRNCAGNGLCGYGNRSEMAEAYVNLIKKEELIGGIYNLFGPKISQQELCELINKAYDLDLVFHSISVEEYVKDRVEAYGEMFGNIIAGIYEGIRNGTFDVESDFEKVVGRPHKALF